MKLESSMPAEERARYKIVRTDSYKDIPGLIISADEADGTAVTLYQDKNESYNFGPGGMRIAKR